MKEWSLLFLQTIGSRVLSISWVFGLEEQLHALSVYTTLLSDFSDLIPKGKCKNLLPVSQSDGESLFQMLHKSPQLLSN